MKIKIYSTLAIALGSAALTGCDDYLDVMPDNRATLDSDEKVKSLLVSAYPNSDYTLFTEVASDNCDNLSSNTYTELYWDDAYNWIDEREDWNNSVKTYWEACYNAIAVTNEALDAIAELGGPTTVTRKELYGEALLCRAYSHFMLAQIFCAPYTQDAAQDLGLPYMDHSETTLRPTYQRGNLADFYTKTQADLEKGLQYVGDSHLDVPKYHFNEKAAWAFAARYYLYTEQWQKAADAATNCLGSQPASVLRDYDAIAALEIDGNNGIVGEPMPMEWIKATAQCNLLFTAPISDRGSAFGRSYNYGKNNHRSLTSAKETLEAPHPMGHIKRFYGAYRASDCVLVKKCLALIEYTDPIAKIGYLRTALPLFTTDEALLNRAEAYTMLGRYNEAAADLNTWAQNITTGCPKLTPELIASVYNAADYSYEDADGLNGTIKKHLNPAFAIDAEGSVQECMLHCVLAFRRIETIHDGMRWFDIRRYGIEIPRRTFDADGRPVKRTDILLKNDPRRIIQIPMDVRSAGLEANPR